MFDVETRQLLTLKGNIEVAKAFEKICSRHLKYSKLLQVDPLREFMGAVSQLMGKHNVRLRSGQTEIRNNQGVVERLSRTSAERLSICGRAGKSPQA